MCGRARAREDEGRDPPRARGGRGESEKRENHRRKDRGKTRGRSERAKEGGGERGGTSDGEGDGKRRRKMWGDGRALHGME